MADDLKSRRDLFVRLFNYAKVDPEFQDVSLIYGASAVRLGDELIAENYKRIGRGESPHG